jgi:hypothetical protein
MAWISPVVSTLSFISLFGEQKSGRAPASSSTDRLRLLSKPTTKVEFPNPLIPKQQAVSRHQGGLGSDTVP